LKNKLKNVIIKQYIGKRGENVVFKKWNIGHPNRDVAKELANEFDIDPFTTLIACTRGITDATELEYFLTNDILVSHYTSLMILMLLRIISIMQLKITKRLLYTEITIATVFAPLPLCLDILSQEV